MAGASSFDLVLVHMCLQAVEDHTNFLRAVKRRLATDGAFLISIPHPAFFNPYKKIIPEREYSYSREHKALIDFSITLDPASPIRRVPYFHRPISSYMSAFWRAGLSVTYFHEVFPSPEVQALYGEPWSTPRYLLLGGTSTVDIGREIPTDCVAVRLATHAI
jgi:SAM-dependent methyltransferase